MFLARKDLCILMYVALCHLSVLKKNKVKNLITIATNQHLLESTYTLFLKIYLLNCLPPISPRDMERRLRKEHFVGLLDEMFFAMVNG